MIDWIDWIRLLGGSNHQNILIPGNFSSFFIIFVSSTRSRGNFIATQILWRYRNWIHVDMNSAAVATFASG
jgi:hypothetical protein